MPHTVVKWPKTLRGEFDMANIKPFKGLRYDIQMVGDIASVVTPPYDIISAQQQEEYYQKNEHNVIRLEYGKELPDDSVTENKYTRAGEFLKSWIDDGILKFEDTDCIYLYEQKFYINGHETTYRGFISLVELEEFSKGIVLPHEETLSKAKTDRFNLMSTTFSNFSQIYCLYIDEQSQLKGLMTSITKSAPDISFTADDTILQNLWIIRDTDTIDKIKSGFASKQLFIADGHHRYETALNFRNKMREENPDWTGDDLFNNVMMMLVDMDDPGLVVFPTHRLVRDLSSFDEVRFVSDLKDNFEIDKIIVERNVDVLCNAMEQDLLTLKETKVFGLYTGGDYFYRLRLKDTSIMAEYLPMQSEAYRNLDVSVLHTVILERSMGIDQANMADQKNLTYTRDAKEAVMGVRSGEYQCAFILNATRVHEIKDVSLAGEKMPQKSTYFYPKLVTGIVMNKFR